MPRGTVKSFDHTHGFGTVVLESGEELPVDISVCNKRDFAVGETAEVTVGVGMTGMPKATLVIFELAQDRAPSFSKGVKQLKELGLLSRWEVRECRSALLEVLGEVPEKLTEQDAVSLLETYYATGQQARGREDGVLFLDWRFGQETGDVVAELLGITDAPKLASLRRMEAERAVVADASGAERTLPVSEGLEPLVAWLNTLLSAAGNRRRLLSLDVGSDSYVFLFREEGFARELKRSPLSGTVS
jgi:cold shock CspA family protein